MRFSDLFIEFYCKQIYYHIFGKKEVLSNYFRSIFVFIHFFCRGLATLKEALSVRPLVGCGVGGVRCCPPVRDDIVTPGYMFLSRK